MDRKQMRALASHLVQQNSQMILALTDMAYRSEAEKDRVTTFKGLLTYFIGVNIGATSPEVKPAKVTELSIQTEGSSGVKNPHAVEE